MKVTYKNSIEFKVIQVIEQLPDGIVLRKDLAHLGSYRQISRILKKLVSKKRLVKISFGIYVRAYQSKYIDEPMIESGFDMVVRKALDRLGIVWEPGNAEQEYNSGESQQVPAYNIVRLKSRLRRKLTYGKRVLLYEGEVNAK